MSVLSALRRASLHQSLLPRRFFSIPSSRPLALVIAWNKLAPEAPDRFYFHYSDPIDWPLVLQDELGLPWTPKILSVVSSFSDDPGVTATFNISYDKLMDTKAYFQEHQRRHNELMASFKKDAKFELRDGLAALVLKRDLAELGSFTARYCEFKIALQQSESKASAGKTRKSTKSKKSSKHANAHALDEGVYGLYRYTKLCEIIATLTPDDFPDLPDAKLIFQARLEEFERLATEAQKWP
ncbi:hypothetical protein SDRG_06391 [Saprolegnia diclina VS20]|uniref:Uncharacterized protein n=1 Tax=Saprolegnia diclina (strain VS20) TaxID=1156394 RepID=T0QNJ0_SAPDV|nr:hypothetical protein SDRG_06391 [Saprolegnia diclina VS20]EQC36286.1 hypothetical protein SDRG_06391 [Saprolegnia diclina VS20]|eukprot:XP_008610392.1 hypothetical protein SDRG_06391 [Saprolegnia diclina VS20]